MSHVQESESRKNLLEKLRAQTIPHVELPGYPQSPVRYDDPRKQFGELLTGIGGRCEVVADLAEAARRISAESVVAEAKHLVQLVPGLPFDDERTIDLQGVDDPHALEWIDVAILRGEFAVAENGAVWCTDALVKHRVVYFLSQHVIVCVPARQIVQNLHEAYARLALGERGFGMFLAGPSKTADIEQSLVIGAHGARSLTVFLVENME